MAKSKEVNGQEYNINFFTPHNAYSRKNNRIIATMLVIWAVAVFGFQFLLRTVEKPTPEKALITYEEIIPKIKENTASDEEYRKYVTVLLNVLGKSLKPQFKSVVQKHLTNAVFHVLPVSEHEEFKSQLLQMQKISLMNEKGFADNASLYNTLQMKIIERMAGITGLQKEHICVQISPYYLSLNLVAAAGETHLTESGKNNAALSKILSSLKNYSIAFKDDVNANLGSDEAIRGIIGQTNSAELAMDDSDTRELSGIMKRYMTHNRSFLTDAVFLGFPFHYWYTAEFLLILFVMLCFIYCKMLDKLNAETSTPKAA